MQMAPTEMATDYYTYKPIKDKVVDGSSLHLGFYLSQGWSLIKAMLDKYQYQ